VSGLMDELFDELFFEDVVFVVHKRNATSKKRDAIPMPGATQQAGVCRACSARCVPAPLPPVGGLQSR
jgi:hypothetical protein